MNQGSSMKKDQLKLATNGVESRLNYVAPQYLSLKSHVHLNERWVQDRIEEDPKILDLPGDLIVQQRERPQPKAGRLDLLLKDQETGRRYTFELQLGVVDEAHIIRAIEYWDNERRRFPEVDHCCVICAETINTRFLNVISLFNRQIPLIAIQVKAVEVNGMVTLVFTKVLDEVPRRLEEDEMEVVAPTDRKTYEDRIGSDKLVNLDKLASEIQQIVGPFKLSYTKPYIGCFVDGRAANFIVFKPSRNGAVRVDLRLRLSEEQVETLTNADIEVLDYAQYWRVHPIRLTKEQVQNPPKEFLDIIKVSYNKYFELT